MTPAIETFVATKSLVEKLRLLTVSTPAEAAVLAQELRARVGAGVALDGAELAWVERVAAGEAPADAAGRAGVLAELVRDALAMALADQLEYPEAESLLGGVVASDHFIAARDAASLERQARLGAEVAAHTHDPALLFRSRELVAEALRISEASTVPARQELAEIVRTAAIVEHGVYRETSRAEHLDAAVSYARRAAEVAPDSGEGTERYLVTLSAYSADRYRWRSDMADLEEALAAARPFAESENPDGLAVLVDALLLHFDRTGSDGGLREAIEHAQRAVELTAGTPAAAGAISNLGNGLLRRFAVTGDPADIDEAVACGRRAADAAEGQAALPGILVNLANALSERFGSGAGDDGDLDAAVDLTARAVDLTPKGGSERATRESNLASHLGYRFQARGNRADLGRAIESVDDAAMRTQSDDLTFAAVLANQAELLCKRFELEGDARDREMAVTLAEEAVRRDPTNGLVLGAMALCLGVVGDGGIPPLDIDGAVEYARRAVDATVATSPAALSQLANLAGLLALRFQAAKDRGDLAEASRLAREVADASPITRPGLATMLGNFARVLELGLTVEWSDDAFADLTGLLERWAQLCERGLCGRYDVTVTGPRWVHRYMPLAKFGPPPIRKLIARIGAAVIAGAEALSELPADTDEATRRAHALDLRQAIDGVGAMAAYAHILAYGNDALGALDILERGLTTVAVEQAGGPLWMRAREAEPELVSQLTTITRRLRVARRMGKDVEALWAERQALHDELERRVGRLRVRRAPGELATAARASGVPFRWIAATPAGGFLIVLRPEGHRFTALLPGLTSERVAQWHSRLHPGGSGGGQAIRGARGAGGNDAECDAPHPTDVQDVLADVEDALAAVISWWDDAAWLVPVGLLATLPWQARWPDLRLHSSGALHVVAHAHSSRAAPSAAAGLLNDELEGVASEAAALERRLGATVLRGRAASRERLAGLGRLGVLHFGVHGTTDPALELEDGDLLPDDLANFRDQFSSLRLLFANACFSAALTEGALDEAVGFATAGAVTGTAATIAALWPVHSETASRFAADFYARFADDRDPHTAVAHARRSGTPANERDSSLAAYQLWGH